MSVLLDASRMSSVFGLNASPQSAITLPRELRVEMLGDTREQNLLLALVDASRRPCNSSLS